MQLKSRLLIVFLITPLSVCCQGESTHVYVPAPDYRQKLSISVVNQPFGSSKAGEWLELKATRATGPWVKIERTQLDPEGCWWARQPPAIEENVQGNVRWHVDPKDFAVFNIPGRDSRIGERFVRFTKRFT